MQTDKNNKSKPKPSSNGRRTNNNGGSRPNGNGRSVSRGAALRAQKQAVQDANRIANQ
jgi:hypothetical protein